MGTRWLGRSALVLLSGCCYGYGYGRTIELSSAVDAHHLQEVLSAEPGLTVRQPWNGEQLHFVFARDGGEASLVYGGVPGPAIDIGSLWFNHVPDDATFAASMALQEALLTTLSRAVPGLPPPAACRGEWVGLASPRGGELAALRARYEQGRVR